jgi:hypothetical protein
MRHRALVPLRAIQRRDAVQQNARRYSRQLFRVTTYAPCPSAQMDLARVLERDNDERERPP